MYHKYCETASLLILEVFVRKFIVMALIICMSNHLFAQETIQENNQVFSSDQINPQKVILIPFGLAFVFGEQFGFGFSIGGAYEGVLNNYFSLVGGVRYNFYGEDSIYSHRFGLFGQFRLYPQGNSSAKFFAGGQITEYLILISYNGDNAISYITSVSPLLGYKFVPDYTKRHCFEFWLGYNFDFGKMNYPQNVIGNDSIFDGLIFGIVFGIKGGKNNV
jgi:hypothetical protein